jgi:hypothetical protein
MIYRLVVLVLAVCGVAPLRADVAEVFVSSDATLYSDLPAGSLANGSGQYFFAGVNGPNNDQNIRRALLMFDLTALIPPGALVTSATLRVTVDRVPTGAGPSDFTLHAASSGWGEGPSDPTGLEGTGTTAGPGDATWTEAFFGSTPWVLAGGDFAPTASAVQSIGGVGEYLFTGPGLLADVQGWVNDPGGNFGWFLLGDETGDRNARRFISGDLGDPDAEPLLLVGYLIPEPSALALSLLGLALLRARRPRS